MATRYYFPRVTAANAEVSPAFSDVWDVIGTASSLRAMASTTKTNTSLLSSASSETRETSATIGNCLHRQWVSAPIGAQTISGTISLVFRGGPENGLLDGSLQFVLRVVSNDGQTERGVLYGGHTEPLGSTAGVPGHELGPSSQTRHWAGVALTPVTALNGDRLVFELGHRYHNTITTAYGAYYTLGDPTATADHALSSGVTTTLVPWAELSATIAEPGSTVTVEAAGQIVSESVVAAGVGLELATAASVVSNSSVTATGLRVQLVTAQVVSGSTVTAGATRTQWLTAPIVSGSVVSGGASQTGQMAASVVSPSMVAITGVTRQRFAVGSVVSTSSVSVGVVRQTSSGGAVVSGSVVSAGASGAGSVSATMVSASVVGAGGLVSGRVSAGVVSGSTVTAGGKLVVTAGAVTVSGSVVTAVGRVLVRAGASTVSDSVVAALLELLPSAAEFDWAVTGPMVGADMRVVEAVSGSRFVAVGPS